MPVDTGSRSGVAPSHGSGVYLAVFANGDVAVVRWNGGPGGSGWEWGSLNPPGPVQMAIWMAPTFEGINGLAGSIITHLKDAANLSIGQYRSLIHMTSGESNNVQPGTKQYGHPVLIPRGIKPGQNAPGFKAGSGAIPAGIDLPGVGGVLGGFVATLKAIFSLDFLKGIGLILAGVAILVFAALELRKAV